MTKTIFEKAKIEIVERLECSNCKDDVYKCDECSNPFDVGVDIVYCDGFNKHICEDCHNG